MLKKINLLSLTQASEKLSEDGFKSFIEYHNIKYKKQELNDLKSLVSQLKGCGFTASQMDNFFICYKIPQISKEFDLLRFGENCVVNIELKSVSTEEKILKQLKRNKYYLKFLGKPVHHFTFESDKNTLYLLKNDNTLEIISPTELVKILQSQKVKSEDDVNSFFNPSDYLVSPFNSTENFLKGEYFFTSQQEELKRKILKSINNSSSANFISITGGAGTGKTLLAYDIVKSVMESNKKSLIFHCGKLNDGHNLLRKAGWEIAAIRVYEYFDLAEFDLILIDESQRLKKDQIDCIKKKISQSNGNCIFAYDKLQTLSKAEETVDASGQISDLCDVNAYSLTNKIRTNKEIANFITLLFDSERNFEQLKTDNIQIRYFNDLNDAKSFLDSLNGDEWEVLRFTPSRNKEFHYRYSEDCYMNSHEVFGQEFDGVAVLIDRHFAYDCEGKLTYTGTTFYEADKMLFQNITRARKRLLVIIVDNEKLLKRCMSIT